MCPPTNASHVSQVSDLDDPRLADYRDLKHVELAAHTDRFIAEGELLVRRLIESDFPVVSVLLTERRAAEIAPFVPPGVPVYVGSEPLLRQVVGYQFHSGVLGVGRRKPMPAIEQLVPRPPAPALLVICPDLTSGQNVGAIARSAAALGASGLLLGERSFDPYWRQSIRVSMGAVFSLPIRQSANLIQDLAQLRDLHDIQLLAAVLDPSAQPLSRAPPTRRVGILFGNEAQGLSAEHVALCDRQVTIDMHRGTDSLNVAAAAAIFCYVLSGWVRP